MTPAELFAAGMTWHHVAFAHFALPPPVLAPFVPAPLALDLFEHRAWLSVVLLGIRPRGLSRAAWPLRARPFLQMNVRTYVRANGTPGLFFLRIDVESRLLALGGRRLLALDARPAHLVHQAAPGEWRFASSRRGLRRPQSAVEERFWLRDERLTPEDDAVRFLLERYSMFCVRRSGRLVRLDVEHAAWTPRLADAELDTSGLFPRLSVSLPKEPDVAHVVDRRDASLRCARA